MTLIVIAALFIVCRRVNPGFFKSSVIIGAGCAVTIAAAFAVSLSVGSGTFTENLAAFKASFEETVRNGVTRIAQSSDGIMTMSQNDLDLAIATMITLIPGAAAAFCQVAGAFAYSIFKLLTKIFGGKIGRKEGEFHVPPSCMLFFALSVVLSMIFSLFKSLEVAELAAVNLAIALAPATLFNGAYKIVYKVRHPLIVVLPDGTKMRRAPVFLIGSIFLSALISFLFPVFIIILYSIFSTVKELIINSRKQDGK